MNTPQDQVLARAERCIAAVLQQRGYPTRLTQLEVELVERDALKLMPEGVLEAVEASLPSTGIGLLTELTRNLDWPKQRAVIHALCHG